MFLRKLPVALSLLVVIAAAPISARAEPQNQTEGSVNLSAWKNGVLVIGEVRTPQMVLFRERLTLSEALRQCDGFTDLSDTKNIVVFRNGKTRTCDLSGVLSSAKDPTLLPGDCVYVSARADRHEK